MRTSTFQLLSFIVKGKSWETNCTDTLAERLETSTIVRTAQQHHHESWCSQRYISHERVVL